MVPRWVEMEARWVVVVAWWVEVVAMEASNLAYLSSRSNIHQEVRYTVVVKEGTSTRV